MDRCLFFCPPERILGPNLGRICVGSRHARTALVPPCPPLARETGILQPPPSLPSRPSGRHPASSFTRPFPAAATHSSSPPAPELLPPHRHRSCFIPRLSLWPEASATRRRPQGVRHFSRPDCEVRICPMDSSEEFFYKNNIMRSSSSDSSSDDESDSLVATLIVNEHVARQRPLFRGSLPGRSPALDRNGSGGHVQLYGDYFRRVKLTYPPKIFRCRFRMRRSLFNRIRLGVMHFDDYFICKRDAVGTLGFSSYQKCTAAIRMLAYGVAGDLVDEYVRMSETTCLEAMYKFCKTVIQVFGTEY